VLPAPAVETSTITLSVEPRYLYVSRVTVTPPAPLAVATPNGLAPV
jgi:hypothetical protein